MLKLLFNHGIMRRIFIVLIVFEILLVSYVNLYFYPKIQQGNRVFAESSIKKLVEEKSKGLESLFKQVEYEVENLGLWVNEILEHEITDAELKEFHEDYYVNEDNILTNHINLEKYNKDKGIIDTSNVFFSYDGTMKLNDISDIINTSKLELQFEKASARIPFSEWLYVITDNNMIRMYPSTYNSFSNFEYKHDFKEDVYYYIANEKNDPERKAVWTNPYIDYLGRGLVITCSYPIYKDDVFIGVVCIDIGLQGIKKSISDLSIEGTGITFLVDKDGHIIYYPNYETFNSEKGYVVNDRIDMFSTSKSESVIFEDMLKEGQGIKFYSEDTKNSSKRLLVYDKIKGLDWIIGIQVDSKEYMEDNIIVNENIWSLAIFSTILIILLLLYFYNYLSKPILKLVEDIQMMGNKYVVDFGTYENNDEVEILDHAFKNLKNELDEYIKNLYYKNKQFQTVFDNMPGILYIMDSNYVIHLINSKGQKNFFEKESEIKFKRCYEIFFNRIEICENCPVANSIICKNEYSTEVKDSGRIYSISSFPTFNRDGTIREIIVHSLNITEDKIKGLELANAERFALIGQVAASVTHELKNNISVIKGVYYILNEMEKENKFDAFEIKELLSEFKESIRNVDNTTYGLLEFSNKNEDEDSYANIISIIEQILILEKNNFYKNNIKIIKKYDYNELYVHANANSLKFIFINIITNAVEAMKGEGGNITIKIYVSHSNKYVHIEISDTGRGIPDKIRDNIFEPFVSTKEKGSGLGLWIAKNQVKKINGHIYCESKINVGSTFIVVIPLNKGEI